MAKKKILTIALIAVIGLSNAFAGGGGERGTSAEDFIIALDGNAAADGNTITLTANAWLTGHARLVNTALVVPQGITLDVTADGAHLALGNNAVLTVNGTVNARGHGDHGGVMIESALRNPATINGNGAINLKSKGHLIGVFEGRKLILDGVTLAGLADNDSPLVNIGGGSELVMKSGAVSGNTGCGVGVWAGSTFTMEGGTITGNTASNNGGGGVFLINGGTFTMDGGEISGNSAGNDPGGGGVRVYDSTFTMNGGTVYGSEAAHGAKRNTVRNGSGAALFVDSGTARYGDGTNILPHTDRLSNRTDNTIAGRR